MSNDIQLYDLVEVTPKNGKEKFEVFIFYQNDDGYLGLFPTKDYPIHVDGVEKIPGTSLKDCFKPQLNDWPCIPLLHSNYSFKRISAHPGEDIIVERGQDSLGYLCYKDGFTCNNLTDYDIVDQIFSKSCFRYLDWRYCSATENVNKLVIIYGLLVDKKGNNRKVSHATEGSIENLVFNFRCPGETITGYDPHKFAIPNDKLLILVAHDAIISKINPVYKIINSGLNCFGCNEYNHYAEPNMHDSRYICYSCRDNYMTMLRLGYR